MYVTVPAIEREKSRESVGKHLRLPSVELLRVVASYRLEFGSREDDFYGIAACLVLLLGQVEAEYEKVEATCACKTMICNINL